jgi:TolA-binding protein
MAQLLQGNPQLWAVAGDLFVKNMDWPGAQEMAKRFAKTIDPKLMQDGEDTDPALMQAQQQMQAMAQEMEQMHQMLQNASKSIEAQEQRRLDMETQIKAFDAETKRISAVQASMTPEQIQDIVMGTLHAAIDTGDVIGKLPEGGELGEESEEQNEAV